MLLLLWHACMHAGPGMSLSPRRSRSCGSLLTFLERALQSVDLLPLRATHGAMKTGASFSVATRLPFIARPTCCRIAMVFAPSSCSNSSSFCSSACRCLWQLAVHVLGADIWRHCRPAPPAYLSG